MPHGGKRHMRNFARRARRNEGRKKKNQKLLAHETNSLLMLFMYFFFTQGNLIYLIDNNKFNIKWTIIMNLKTNDKTNHLN
jgi:hypothetical protein